MDRALLALALAALGLYAATLQPVAGWGDSAKLILLAHEARFEPKSGHHPLHNLLGAAWLRLTVWTPWSVAARMNLLSALAGALGVWLAGRLGFLVTRSRIAALAGATALMVSHVFWHLAVVTESYTLHVALFLAVLLFLARWDRDRRRRDLALAFILLGLTWANRSNTPMYAPAILVFLALTGYPWRDFRLHARLLGCLALGFLPWILVAALRFRDDPGYDFSRLFADAFETENAHRLFIYHPLDAAQNLARDYPPHLGYQFVGVAFILGIWGLGRGLRHHRAVSVLLLLCWVTNALFSSAFFDARVPFFRVTGYAIFSVFVAVGCAGLGEFFRYRGVPRRRLDQAWHPAKSGSAPSDQAASPAPSNGGAAGQSLPPFDADTTARVRKRVAVALALIALAPPVLYVAVPTFFEQRRDRLPAAFSDRAAIPGRDFLWYFLCPAKHFDAGPEETARETLVERVPEGSLLLADFTALMPLVYYQQVEGWGAGVTLEDLQRRTPTSPAGGHGRSEQDFVDYLTARMEEQPVFLFHRRDPAYCWPLLESRFRLIKHRTVVELRYLKESP